MSVIAISQQLWFEEDPRGATLTCRSGEGSTATIFHVGISRQSLQEFNQELIKGSSRWTIRDGSLLAQGDREALTLRFSSCVGPAVEASLSLYGIELEAFRWAVHAFAAQSETALN